MHERICELLVAAGIRDATRLEVEPEVDEAASAPCAKACSLFVRQFEVEQFGLRPADAEEVRQAIDRGDYDDLEKAYWHGWRLAIARGLARHDHGCGMKPP